MQTNRQSSERIKTLKHKYVIIETNDVFWSERVFKIDAAGGLNNPKIETFWTNTKSLVPCVFLDYYIEKYDL
jgi:CRISPR/Cas system CMR-associated protein Cmr1 (group 7 of RAMP superfamily)